MIDTNLPFLTKSGNALRIVQSGYSALSFTFNGTSYVNDSPSLDALTCSNAGNSSEDFAWYTTTGQIFHFYGVNSNIAAGLRGQLKSFTDAGGNQTTTTYNGSNQLSELRRTFAVNGVTVTEALEYAYYSSTNSSGSYAGKIQTVTLQRSTDGGSTFETVQSVTYKYYADYMSNGNAGDLMSATVNSSNGTAVQTEYYRYYTSFTSTSYIGGLKYRLSAQAYSRALAAGITPETASDATLAYYATLYLEYDASERVTKQRVAGVGTNAASNPAANGTFTFSYFESSNEIDYNAWAIRATETLPDGSSNTVYSNGYGDVMLMDHFDGSTHWRDYYRYDSQGRVILHSNPSAGNNYTESYADLVNYISGNAAGISDSDGLLEITNYYSSTTATVNSADTLNISNATPGGAAGYVQYRKIRHGETGTDVLQESMTYFGHTSSAGATIFVIAQDTLYANTDGTGDRTTTYGYSFARDMNNTANTSSRANLVTATYAIVNESENGPGTDASETRVMDSLGRVIWHKDSDGYLTYYEYDPKTGTISKSIQDVNTANTGDFANLPATWSTPSGGGLHVKDSTTYKIVGLGSVVTATDPKGNLAYTFYDDVHHATFSISAATLSLDGSGNGTLTSIAPIEMVRQQLGYTYNQGTITLGGMYTELMTFSGTLEVSGYNIIFPSFKTSGNTNLLDLIGTGTTGNPQFKIQSLSRSLYNVAGQLVASTEYAQVDNATYLATSTGSAYCGVSGVNYYKTTYDYDTAGRETRTVSATGTITDRVFDSLGRLVNTFIGTDDTPGADTNSDGQIDWKDYLDLVRGSPSTSVDQTNMTRVSTNVYDGSNSGDSNLTQTTSYPGAGMPNRTAAYYYDWRDRLVATKGAVEGTESTSDNTHFIRYSDLNNLGEVSATYVYDGDNVSITTTSGVPDKPSASLLRQKESFSYDVQGRVFLTTTYTVDPSSGTVGAGINTNTWRDLRGNIIKVLTDGSPVVKTVVDGLGRAVKSYLTDGGGDAAPGVTGNWTDAGNVSGDVVLSQTENVYDADSNTVLVITRERFHDATGTGALNDINNQPKARVSYTMSYYDAANRLTTYVDVGTNNGVISGGTAGVNLDDDSDGTLNPPSALPTRTGNTYTLITSYAYTAAGFVDTVTDPNGTQQKAFYDALGRKTFTVSAWDGAFDPTTGSHPSSGSANQTTGYTYDGANHVLTLTAVLPSGQSSQTTQYVYGVDTSTLMNPGDSNSKSGIASNDLLAAVRYPDNISGAASQKPEDQESFVYDALGELLYKRDRNGLIHKYSFDILGRQTSDQVVNINLPILDNASFETPTVFNFAQGPSGANWTFTGTAGIAHNGGTYVAATNAIDGVQYAYLKNTGSMSRSISNFGSGTYRIVFTAAQAVGNSSAQDFAVQVDGVTVATFKPSSTSWDTYWADFTVAGGTHTLSYVGLNTAGGASNVVLIDVAFMKTLVASPTPIVVNSGFESALGSSNWAATGTAGSSTGQSPREGSYAGWISGGSSNSLTQTLKSLTPGTYTLYFYAKQDAGNGSPETFWLTFAGTTQSPAVIGTAWTTFIYTFTVSSFGDYTLSFTGTGSAGLKLWIDGVKFAPNGPPVGNSSFESPSMAGVTNHFQYAPAGATWTFGSFAGISANNGSIVPTFGTSIGTQFAFIQGAGSGSYFSQDIQFFSSGTYQVQFYAAQRVGGGVAQNQDFDIYVDGVLVNSASHLKPTNGNWQLMTSNSFTVDAGTHTLRFQGVNTAGGDNTVVIEAVSILNLVPSAYPGLDTSVLRIDTGYNTQGLQDKVTSYSNTAGNTVVNQVQNTYNGFGQIIKQAQEHNGTAGTSSLAVQYSYDSASKGSRPSTMTYPNGMVLTYDYGSSGGLNDVIGRLESIQQGTLTLESYSYLGLSTVVKRSHPEVSAGLDLTSIKKSTESVGDAGDQYTGLDRFGRVVDERWMNSAGSDVDRYTYGYDRNGNVLSKTNVVKADHSLDETYAYDNLNRLAAANRNGSGYQTWTLDALGNMTAVATGGGTTDYRITNAQNQLVSMNGTSSGASANTFLAYDSNGNTIIDDQAHVLKYDAWNRLTVTADLAGNVKMTYTYDGLGRRIGEKNGAATDLYSTDGWQILEERTGVSAGNSGIVKSQNVWSPVYVNALILRARDADNDGSHTLEERLYAMQDANYNVTGIANTSGSVQERFVYDAYGKVSVKDASWANATDSRNWLVTYQGGRFNAATNLYYFDLRGYSPTMMKWIQADPAGYMDSLNRYGFVRNSPLLSVDPEGLATLTQIVTTDAPSVPKTLGDKVIDSVLNGDGKVIPTTLTNTGRLVPQSSVSGLSTAGGLTIIAAEAYWIWWKCDSEAQKTQQYYDQQMAAEREGARVQQQIRQWKLSHPNGNGGGTSKTSTRTTTPGNYTDPQTSGGGQQPPSKPPTNTATGQCDPDDEGNRPPNLTPDGAGRNGAFRQAKEDAGIPRSQQPVRVREVPDRQSPGRMTREYDFEIPKPGGGTRTVTIQEHPNGHVYPDNPSQNRGPHFNGPNGGHYDY